MLILGNRRMSQLSLCLEAAPVFLLDDVRARTIIAQQIAHIKADWPAVCDEAGLGEAERSFLWRRQFLNPFAFQGLPDEFGMGVGA
jgi:serine/threonine-protein kinase HipA